MSTPGFFWYPDPSGPLKIIDLAELASDIQEEPVDVALDAYDGDQRGSRSYLGSRSRVRIILERFAEDATTGSSQRERDLVALRHHLARGRSVGFALDMSKAWAGLASSPPAQGSTTILTGGNAFSAWASTAELVDGDEVVVESIGPDPYVEICVWEDIVMPIPARTYLASPGTRFTHTTSTVVRHRDFWPVLRLPADQLSRAIVPSDRRLNWTLDVTLEYSVADVVALWLASSSGSGGSRMAANAIGSLPLAGADVAGVVYPGSSGSRIGTPSRTRLGSSLDDLLAGASTAASRGLGWQP